MALFRALHNIEPFGEVRDDWRIAKLAATIAGLIGAKKEDNTLFSAKDFILEFQQEGEIQKPRQQSVEEIERHMIDMVKANNKAWAERGKSRRRN